MLLLPLLGVRLVAALTSPIPDCDEVFNYYEPTFYLVYGQGLQTWEYSSAFALRSYAYLAPHAAVAAAASRLTADRVSVFYMLRCVLAVTSALFEARFVERTGRAAGAEVGWLTWLLLLSSAGMFHASVAFLPSTFAMLFVMGAWSAWMHAGSEAAAAGSGVGGDGGAAGYRAAIWCVATAALIGWPFVIVVAAPLAVDAICTVGLARFALHSLRAAAALLLPSVALDTYFYGRLALGVLHQFVYNLSAREGSGSQLYGTEPWHYYVHNLALNFNLALPLALLAPPALALHAATRRRAAAAARDGDASGALGAPRLALVLSGCYLWLVFFSAIPHKEERFMFPIYPLLCLAAAVALSHASRALSLLLPRTLGRARVACVALAVLGCATVSGMRAAALVRYYGAPLRLYAELASARPHDSTRAELLVCLGKEWYRYPSSFFLPRGAAVGFVRDGFTGQLPAHFLGPAPGGTRAAPGHFNEWNREEESRYVPPERCDVLVDLELPSDGEGGHPAARGKSVWRSRPFLDAARSPGWARALLVPYLSDASNVYARYVVLAREGALA